MFKLKSDFELTLTTGRIVTNKVWANNNVLFLTDGDENYKFENGAWYIKTPLTKGQYIALGYGSLPGYQLAENVNVEDADAFNALFEKVEDEQAENN